MQSEKTSLICDIVGICFVAISLFIFGFLSIPGTILGILAIVFNGKSKQEGGYGSVGGLVTGILATVIGVIAAILWIIVLINLANIGM